LRELRLAALAPVIPESNGRIDAFRSALRVKLDELIDRRVVADPAELHSSGAAPPHLLTYQGRDDRPLKREFARLFTAALPATAGPSACGAGLPRVGVVVTRGHEGVFARCQGELVARLGPRQLRASIVCRRSSANVLRHLLPQAPLDYFLIPDRVDEAAAVLRSAGFDLLYYWELGTDATNYFLPYFRPARVQAGRLGVPATSGVPTMDWYASAAELDPPGAEAQYTERLARLPSLPTYYLRPPSPNGPADRGRFERSPGEHLYLCQQNLRKVHPDFDAVIADILRSDPTGRLVVIADEQPQITAMLLDRFRRSLPDVVDRVRVSPRLERPDYLALVAAADVILDTLHYGGGANTVYDAAACGTSTVTQPGEWHRGR
jgi:protein O-GlcNAc transferase